MEAAARPGVARPRRGKSHQPQAVAAPRVASTTTYCIQRAAPPRDSSAARLRLGTESLRASSFARDASPRAARDAPRAGARVHALSRAPDPSRTSPPRRARRARRGVPRRVRGVHLRRLGDGRRVRARLAPRARAHRRGVPPRGPLRRSPRAPRARPLRRSLRGGARVPPPREPVRGSLRARAPHPEASGTRRLRLGLRGRVPHRRAHRPRVQRLRPRDHPPRGATPRRE